MTIAYALPTVLSAVNIRTGLLPMPHLSKMLGDLST
jgi:hypothetical protein